MDRKKYNRYQYIFSNMDSLKRDIICGIKNLDFHFYEGTFSKEQLKLGVHWIFADLTCLNCKLVQPVSQVSLDGNCRKCNLKLVSGDFANIKDF